MPIQSEAANKRQYVAYLDCRHEIRFSIGEPSPGDQQFCTRCYSYQTILHCAGRFGNSCRHCRYSKSYGGKVSAVTFAEKHTRKYRQHIVDVHGPEGFHMEVTTGQSQYELIDCPF